MRLLLFYAPLFAFLTAAQDGKFMFIYPGQPGVNSDYATDPVIPLGSSMNISWSGPTNESISLTLYQQRPNDAFQYIFRKHLLLAGSLHYS
jgi:hypothetical protein